VTITIDMIVTAFDIGIKNLAYCIFDTDKEEILGWENVNLLKTDASAEDTHACMTSKSVCNVKATWSCGSSGGATATYCRRHIPPTHRLLQDVSGTVLKTIPSLTDIKVMMQTMNISAQGCKKKEDYIARLSTVFALPIQKSIKKVNATHVALHDIHDAIRKMLEERASLFNRCSGNNSHILLENQPVFKNPTMKSVQIILFTTLRDYYYANNLPQPTCHFIHAGKKVQGATKGDAGYAERKGGSEARAAVWLEAATKSDVSAAKELFARAQKKSDLADALCMCIDFGSK
jgi:hypothetical protein